LKSSGGDSSFANKINGVANAFKSIHVRLSVNANLEFVLGLQDDVHKPGTIHLEIVDEQARILDGFWFFDADIRLDQFEESLADLITVHSKLLLGFLLRSYPNGVLFGGPPGRKLLRGLKAEVEDPCN
jgi:hypothetical protein